MSYTIPKCGSESMQLMRDVVFNVGRTILIMLVAADVSFCVLFVLAKWMLMQASR